MSDVIAQLFPWLPSDRLSTFSCGHIVPRSHVQTLCLTKGPTGSLLEFKYAQQTDQRLLNELGQVILNFCSVVPGGMVVFFPSYSSLNLAQKAWGATQHMVKFGMKKTVSFTLLRCRMTRLSVSGILGTPSKLLSRLNITRVCRCSEDIGSFQHAPRSFVSSSVSRLICPTRGQEPYSLQ